LKRGSTTIGVSLAILLVLALPFSLNSAAQSDQPIGSEWVYDYTEEAIGIVLSGKLTYSCERITSTALGGTDREVVEYKSVLSATASISPDMSGYVEGGISEIGTEYYDLETDDLIGYVYNSAQTLDAAVVGLGSLSMSWVERNETYYLPPGGAGIEPSTIHPGDTWQKS
jgi:hypothetical protein